MLYRQERHAIKGLSCQYGLYAKADLERQVSCTVLILNGFMFISDRKAQPILCTVLAFSYTVLSTVVTCSFSWYDICFAFYLEIMWREVAQTRIQRYLTALDVLCTSTLPLTSVTVIYSRYHGCIAPAVSGNNKMFISNEIYMSWLFPCNVNHGVTTITSDSYTAWKKTVTFMAQTFICLDTNALC